MPESKIATVVQCDHGAKVPMGRAKAADGSKFAALRQEPLPIAFDQLDELALDQYSDIVIKVNIWRSRFDIGPLVTYDNHRPPQFIPG